MSKSNVRERFLVAKSSDYNALKACLKKAGSSTKGGWETYYRDPETGEEWCDFYPAGDRWWEGQPCLMKLPKPSNDELIETACSTEYAEEAAAASLIVAKDPEALCNVGYHF